MGFRIKHTMIALPEEMFSQMLEGDNEEQSEEDLTLVICRNITALFGWAVAFEKVVVSCGLWKSCYELRAMGKIESRSVGAAVKL